MRIRPYILAGGKSSRMGTDKAMLELEGKTLLARAVEMLRSVTAFGWPGSRVEVTISGQRDVLEGADRAIVDRFPSCGPLGGMEAALADLTAREDADWAFFIPVDMPLLSAASVDHLLAGWTREIAAREHLRACLVEVDGRPQPLVSLVHKSVFELTHKALVSGTYKVVPVLQSAGSFCTSFDQEHATQDRGDISGIHECTTGKPDSNEYPFMRASRQFLNVNTEADLKFVATLLGQVGSNRQL